MRIFAIRLLSVTALILMGACGSPEDAAPGQPQGESALAEEVAEVSPGTQADDNSGNVVQNAAAATYPAVSRTRTGNGGVIALAGEATFEFDWELSNSHCEAAEGRFKAKGRDPDNTRRHVAIDYANLVDPNSGRSLGPAIQLDVRTREDEVWAAYMGTGIAGKIEDISQAESTGGGTTLTVTGIASGFRNNGAMIGRKVPFRLEATCE